MYRQIYNLLKNSLIFAQKFWWTAKSGFFIEFLLPFYSGTVFFFSIPEMPDFMGPETRIFGHSGLSLERQLVDDTLS